MACSANEMFYGLLAVALCNIVCLHSEGFHVDVAQAGGRATSLGSVLCAATWSCRQKLLFLTPVGDF